MSNRTSRSFAITARAAAALLACAFSMPVHATAAAGNCGQPKSGGAAPSAADALEVLRTAVGLSDCGGFDPCICDVDASGNVVAGDALRVLKKAVGQALALECPCTITTTTVTTTTTTLEKVLTTELLVLTKAEGSYSTADLAGTWDSASLASGPAAPRWERGTLTVQSNGNFTGSTTASDGATEDIAGKLSLASNGILTCTQNCYPTFQGAVDSGKTVSVVTDTLEDGTTVLMVITRRAASYAQPDLTGTWALGGLESGPGAPQWTRGTFLVESNGAFDADVIASNGLPGDFSGTMSLSSNGRITCSSCPDSFRGALDAGKTLGAATQTVGNGSSDLLLLGKQAASYSQSDLTGTWNLGSLATGLDEPWWSRGTLFIAAGGALSGNVHGSDGSIQPASGVLSISADGIVTNSGDPDFRCALDAGKTVLVCTNTW